MTNLAPDARRSAVARGIPLALLASASFGLSGALARGLMDLGWSAGAATTLRVSVAALFLLVPGMMSMRSQWYLLRKGAGVVVVYGVLAVAAAQLFYFLAVARLDVGVALLVEYTAPIAVVGWLWVRRGNKPSRVTVAGAAIAAVGLVLLLNVVGGGSIDLVGVAWALGAMVGAAAYFVMGSDESNGLPPIALASGGVLVAAVVLVGAVLTGVLPFTVAAGSVDFRGFSAPWWAVVLVLGVVTAGISYVAGIAATRALGARLASFVSLTEVIAAATFAWMLLGQTPLPIQLGGAALVLVGVIVVKAGERVEQVTDIDRGADVDVDAMLAVVVGVVAVAAVAALDSAEEANDSRDNDPEDEAKPDRVPATGR